MVDSITLYNAYTKKVRLIDNNDKEYIGVMDFFESEYDSGSGVAEIGLSCRNMLFSADEIKSIEIID